MKEIGVPALYLNQAKRLLYPLGIWLPPEKHKFAYFFLTTVMVLFQYSFLVAEIMYIAQVWGDLDATSEASYMCFTHGCLCYKMTTFLAKRKTLTHLIDFMDLDTFKPKNKKHKEILEFQAQKIKRICMCFIVLVYFACVLYGLVPLFEAAGTFPFRTWMPKKKEQSPQYQLGYAYQMTAIYLSATIFNGVDSVALSMMIFAVAELHIIKDKILSIRTLDPMPRTLQTPSTSKISSRQANYKELSGCIYHHQTLIRFIMKLEDAYHTNIFFQVSGSVGMICLSGLRIYVVDPKSIQFSSMVSYLFCMLLQVYTYCWCGHELTITSEELRDVLYLCPWYTQDRSFNKSLWIAMERMKKPIVFRTGKYIPLSLQTFVSILRSSYSYFAVLQQMRSK